MLERLSQLFHDVKFAASVAAVTVTSSLGFVLDKLGTLVGIILSSVLIYTHWRRGRIEYKKTQLEIELLQAKRDRERRANTLGDDRSTFGRAATALGLEPDNTDKRE